MIKILVVEDDQYFLEALCDLLKHKNYSVFTAPNGKVAQDIISMQNFDLVISDIQMPNLTGVELLKWSQTNHKELPFILMTGFSMLLETQTAYELGAKEFISKPFKQADLLGLIEKVTLDKKKPIPVEDVSENYCKVSVDEFISRPKNEFDIYIKLSNQKFLKISNKGDILDRTRVDFYRSKGVKHLYLLKEDFQKLISLTLNIGRIIKDRTDISSEKKISFMKYTGEVILEKAFSNNVDPECFEDAQNYLKITTDVISDSPVHLDLLHILSQHSEQVYAHSVGVMLFSVMIAKAIGYESNFSLSKISMAALFHDIGKKEIDAAILNKPRFLLTADERKIYESHATRGRDILLAMKTTPSEVVQIVYEHHEDSTGQGYPLGKNKKTPLHNLSRIVHCANLFVEQGLKDGNNAGSTGLEAIAAIESLYAEQIDPLCMKGLKKIYLLNES